ncbi:ABC transporter ATP-binding protein [Taklimakanibacter lacteus]|uniref:ABC transporter ATP-binding protein n=1 Tax=Taklimakanibacter lacteus TaxID=2268456 RepID=UPI000E6661D1
MRHASDHELLRVDNVRKSFRTPESGVVTPLDGITLSIRNNEFLTLLGPSGCGKTTLLKTIAGFEDLDEGEIYLDGRPMSGVPAHRRPFNTVFQNYALFPHMTVAGNVGYGLQVAGVPRAEEATRVADVLRLVGLSGLERRKPAQLSGGQQQRVALARALVNRPRVLLLDESLSALDRKLRQSMQIELKNLQHTVGITFIFVTHDQEEALTMSDRIAVMDKGRILQLGTPAEIYDQPASRFVAGFIGTSNIFTGTLTQDNGAARVQVAGGPAIAVTAGGFTAGEQVDVMLRPEHFALVPGGNAASGSIVAVIENIVFVGTDLHLHGRLGNGMPVMALERHARAAGGLNLKAGQTVTLHYQATSPHLMKSGAA